MSPLSCRISRKNNTAWILLLIFVGWFNPAVWAGETDSADPAVSSESSANEDLLLQKIITKSRTQPLVFVTDSELPPLDGLESLIRVSHTTRAGDTFARVLTRSGLSAKERQSWLHAIGRQKFFRKSLGAGRELHLYFAKTTAVAPGTKPSRRLKALEIDLDDDWLLTWELGDRGIVFNKRARPYDVELKTVAGVVESSLTEDGLRVGLNHELVSQLADIFTWEIDFDREVKPGDSFKVVYEKRSRKVKGESPLFKILAAEVISQDQKHFAIYFEKERDKGAYYGSDGRSLARAFLRFPLEFANISSHFAHSRFHPILKVERPHNGVDFTAKRGTPIRAVGDGKVVYAGWRKGGYGRMVEIEHDSVFSTRYAHMQRFARGMKRGATVKKGQIIGYVGSSGRSTGPHLHYELYKNQQYMDPLIVEFPPEETIEPVLLRLFENAKDLFVSELAATPHS